MSFTPPNAATLEFLKNNLSADTDRLLLKASSFPEVDMKFVVQQITGREKAKTKLPSFAANTSVFFPPSLNLEQSSSEVTATYKNSLLKGNLLVDLTGGFGIDTIAFSKTFQKVIHVERNEALSSLVSYNLQQLKISNVETVCDEAENFVKKFSGKTDAMFIDPSRRVEGKKVFTLHDSEPDIIKLIPLLKEKTRLLLIKTAPLLDVDRAISELPDVKEVHVVVTNRECKEVLYLLDFSEKISEPLLYTIDLDHSWKNTFTRSEEKNAEVFFSAPLSYLYEPHPGIMKSGFFKSIAQKYQVKKLHVNTHLYTSENLISDFPGRRFKIDSVFRYDKAEFKKNIPDGKVNLSLRNFPDSVEVVKKKLGSYDGGMVYLFAVRDLGGKPVLIACSKL